MRITGEFRRQMTREVAAACEGALHAGAKKIVVKDAHETGRNLIAAELPEEVELIRSWSRHPYSMVWGIEEGFDAAAFIGYHSPPGPLTIRFPIPCLPAWFRKCTSDGELCSEYLLHAMVARSHHIPLVFCSGDAGLCERIHKDDPEVLTVATLEATGNATHSIHPQLALKKIRAGVKKSLKKDRKKYNMEVPGHLVLDVRYKNHVSAYRASHYPGATAVNAFTTRIEADNILDIMRFLEFCV
ncbi:MAG: M55 family metallopeptidase [Candidatus Marinimicrobia bacterium]|nr:M55 family metallopeptidase [Candidatus Neomarinimicrobiota bacterium]